MVYNLSIFDQTLHEEQETEFDTFDVVHTPKGTWVHSSLMHLQEIIG